MADAVGSVLSLLGLIMQKLEDVDVCKRKAARMRSYLAGVRPLIQDLQRSQQDTTRIESVLQEILPLVEAAQRRSRSRVARIMAWMNAYKVRSMLEEAEKHLLMELTILRVGTLTPTELEAQHAHENAQDANDDVRQLRSDMDEAEAGGELDPAAHRRMVAVMDEVDPEDLGDRLAQTEHACAEQRAAAFLAKSIAPRLEADVANIDEQALRVDEHTVLGRGAFGEVLAGILYGSERVAVKRVPEQANQLQMYEQQALRREAQHWRSLSHPNIVTLLGTCVQRSRLLLVMERCDLSLDMLLHERVDVELSVEQQATIIKGVARGMAYLHSCNMIHRDIKPANVLLSHALGKVKLTDFGLVTSKAAHTSRAATTSPQGSPAYMAPEVLLPPAVWTTRADVYAFGIVAWEVIHRHRPWADTLSPEDLNDRVRGQGKRPAFSPRVDVQLWLVDLIKECWAQEVNARPQSANLLQRFEANTPRQSTRILKAVFDALKRRSAVRQQPQQPEPQRKQKQRASQHDRDLRVAQSLQKQEELALALEQQAQALERDRQVAEDIQWQLAEEELPGSAAQASAEQGLAPALPRAPVFLPREERLMREVVERLDSIHASVLLPEGSALVEVLEELDDDVRTTMSQRGGFPALALFQRIVELQQQGQSDEAGLDVYRDEGVRAAVLSASANYVTPPHRALTALGRLQKHASAERAVQHGAQPENPVAAAAVRRLSAAYDAVLHKALRKTAEVAAWLSREYGDRIPKGDIMAAHALCIDLKTKLGLYKEAHKLRSLVIQAGLEPHRGANGDRPPHKVLRDEFKGYRELPGRIPAYKLAIDETFTAFAAEDYFAKVIRCVERRRVLQEVSWNLADRTYRRLIKRKAPRPTQEEDEVYVAAGWPWLAGREYQ